MCMRFKVSILDLPQAHNLGQNKFHYVIFAMAKGFSEFGLDDRIVQAVVRMGFKETTPIQESSIPLSLIDRKDIVAQARTGSGKTAAYLIPILHQILRGPSEKSNKGLVIVPTRELAEQAMKVLSQITAFCSKNIRYVNIAQQVPEEVRETLLSDTPDIIIATPSMAVAQLKKNTISGSTLQYLVFDEADLLMSYGYESDLKSLSELIKSVPQVWIMSATLDSGTTDLKQRYCKAPVTLKLTDEESEANKLFQYYVKCSELDKFLLAYIIFKLGLIKGKTIVFVNDIDRGYRLRLFLEQFGIRTVVLNSELPAASRLHIVNQFDRNVYNILIATDDAYSRRDDSKKGESTEYGVSRGIDFKNVAAVLNFDLPVSSKAYTHRVGRTARANKSGMALSFVVPKEEFGKHKIASSPSNRRDEKVLLRIIRNQEALGSEVKPYNFDMNQMNSFRYRMEDGFRAVTRTSVREARIKEIQNELLASEKLQRHFEENPDDLAALRHDNELHPSRTNNELKHVPDYLLPASARITKPIFVAKKQTRPAGGFKKGHGKRKLRRDPLKTFGGR